MIKHNQYGAANFLLVSMLALGLVLALGFGSWAFASRQSYKNNADAKIAVAVNSAKQAEDTKQAAIYAEAAKQPLRTYTGPQTYGSIVLAYPKTWSGYVDDTATGQNVIDGYFAPGVVPSISADGSVFALRLQVLGQPYAQTVQSLSQSSDQTLSIVPYSLPKVPSAVGVKVTGAIGNNTTAGTMVVLPLRDKTVEISTAGTEFLNDFNAIILPNFSFSP